MNKRIKTIAVLFLVFCSSLNAQIKQWTLEECIQHAIENNITIKQIELQKENAEITLNTSQNSRLPDLNARVGQEWSTGFSPTQSGVYESQTQSNSNLSISSSLPVFTGFRIPNEIKKNKFELMAAAENLEKAKEDLSLNIASLFLQVLFNKEIVKVNDEQLLLTQSQIERTKALIEVGKVPQSQLYDIEAQVANDEVSLIQAKNNLELALLDLMQSLELEQASEFDIYTPNIGNVVEEYMSSVQPPHVIFDNAVAIKPVIKEQEYRIESAKKSMEIAKAGYMPSLNLNMGYGTSYFYNYDMSVNPAFSNQFKNNGREYIGLSLSIPIFNRFSVRNQVRSTRVNISNQQLVLDNAKKTLYKEIQTAYLNATSAQEKYRASERAIVATSESFKYAQERYEVGKSSVFEFNEARTRWLQSQSEQIQSKYDYIFRTKILDFYNGVDIKL